MNTKRKGGTERKTNSERGGAQELWKKKKKAVEGSQ